jgi:hypothetical protein
MPGTPWSIAIHGFVDEPVDALRKPIVHENTALGSFPFKQFCRQCLPCELQTGLLEGSLEEQCFRTYLAVSGAKVARAVVHGEPPLQAG